LWDDLISNACSIPPYHQAKRKIELACRIHVAE
jgi:hypothetical protein